MHLQAVQHDELDVVVALADQHLAVAVGGGRDGGGRVGQGHERDRALVHHRRASALQQRQDDLDVLALLRPALLGRPCGMSSSTAICRMSPQCATLSTYTRDARA